MAPKGKGRGRGGQQGRNREQRPGGYSQFSQGQPEQHSGDVAPPTRQDDAPQQQVCTINPEELGFVYKCGIDTPLPRRPGVGKMGRHIKLITNCYKLKIPDGNVYHYDVEIITHGRSTTTVTTKAEDNKYRCLSTKRNREVISQMLQSPFFAKTLAAYDGKKNMYTRYELNIKIDQSDESGKGMIFPVELPHQDADPNDPVPRMDRFSVKIQPVTRKETGDCAINLDSLMMVFEGRTATVPQDAVMAIETILRNYPCQKYIPVGRSFYYAPTEREIHPLGGGKEIWFGYYQSLRLGQWPMVNLDITATTFTEAGPLVHHISKILKTDVSKKILRDSDVKMLNKELRNLRIEVTHLRNFKRKYRILKLVKNAKESKFKLKEGDEEIEISVADYFRQKYRMTLKYPHLPCIQVNPENKKVYLPLEVCDVVQGQHSKQKLKPNENADMIKITARAPRDRFGEIKDIVRRSNFAGDPYLQHFDIQVESTPLTTNARILEPPNLRYMSHQREDRVKPKLGSWEMRGKQYLRAAEIKSWMLLSFARVEMDTLRHFAGLLIRTAGEQGISIGQPDLVQIAPNQNVETFLENVQKKIRADLAVVVVPNKKEEGTIYNRVKTTAETLGGVGLMTQCIQKETVTSKKCGFALVSNILQKINAKAGGVNNSLTLGEMPLIFSKPCIIIGADVNHPGPGVEMKPSIAAVTGSLDCFLSRFAVRVRPQKSRDENKMSIEIIVDLKVMVTELLKEFYRHTKHKPEKIVFFRDGVSEGQFPAVKEKEVTSIRQACRELQKDYEPGITFVVVQKGHHFRFMPQDSRGGVGHMRNIEPGTIVDTVVTHPLNFDFFLCSHFGLQGTSRPCHYTVIEDDNNFTADDLQKLAFYTCHTSARCTKSISVPVPVIYAHLAAYRARAHLVTQVGDDSGSDSSAATVSDLPIPEEVKNAVKVSDPIKNTMYFV